MKVKQKQIMILGHQGKFLISKGTYSGIKRVQINTVEPKQKNPYMINEIFCHYISQHMYESQS